MAGTALNTPERVTACGYVNRRLLIRSLPTSYYLRKPQCCYHQPKSIHSATTATAATAVKRSSSSSYPTKKDRQRDEHHRYIISERSREIDGFHNNSIKATRTNIDSKQFLQERGRGAYTTARTVGRTKVFDLDAHLNRTADNLTAITGTHVSREEIIVETKRVMASSIQAFLQGVEEEEEEDPLETGRNGREIRLTVHATLSSSSFPSSSSSASAAAAAAAASAASRFQEGANRAGTPSLLRISCHAAPLPEIPKSPVVVELRGVARENAKIKDSKWICQRSEIEKLVGPHVNEFVLMDDKHEIITEGSQSNFYALIGGKLYTAGEDVLEGTIRRLVLDVCQRENIPVVLEAPSVSSLMRGEFEGCAISSTSRLLLPVGKVIVPEPLCEADESKDPVLKFSYSSDCLMSFLKRKVQDEIASWSMEVDK